jgi:hypothetical protein
LGNTPLNIPHCGPTYSAVSRFEKRLEVEPRPATTNQSGTESFGVQVLWTSGVPLVIKVEGLDVTLSPVRAFCYSDDVHDSRDRKNLIPVMKWFMLTEDETRDAFNRDNSVF